MLHSPSLLPERPTLTQVLEYLGISKATFYRHYRPAPDSDEVTVEKAEMIWDFFARRLDIREVLKAGRPTLTFDRSAVMAEADERRSRADGPLANTRSSRAARFGKCAEKGFGSRVLKSGDARLRKNADKAAGVPVDCQR